jgi:hypothetical protein
MTGLKSCNGFSLQINKSTEVSRLVLLLIHVSYCYQNIQLRKTYCTASLLKAIIQMNKFFWCTQHLHKRTWNQMVKVCWSVYRWSHINDREKSMGGSPYQNFGTILFQHSLHASPTSNVVKKMQTKLKYTRWFKYDRDWFVCKLDMNCPGHIWTTLYVGWSLNNSKSHQILAPIHSDCYSCLWWNEKWTHRTVAAHRTKVAVEEISTHQSFWSLFKNFCFLCRGPISSAKLVIKNHMIALMKANELNLSLQGRNISIYITTDRISSFQCNLQYRPRV